MGRPRKMVQPKDPSDVVVMERQPDNPAVNLEMLLTKAVEGKLPVETIERLLAVRRELKAEWARDQYYAALARFQSICPQIPKTKVVLNKDGKGIRYRFAPIDEIVSAVKGALEECGFSYIFKTIQTATEVGTVCVSHHRDGHSEETTFTVPLDKDAYMTAPQKVGAAQTFSARYAFRNTYGILTTDEDNDANDPDPETPKTPSQPHKEAPPTSPPPKTEQSTGPAPVAPQAGKKPPEDLVSIINEELVPLVESGRLSGPYITGVREAAKKCLRKSNKSALEEVVKQAKEDLEKLSKGIIVPDTRWEHFNDPQFPDRWKIFPTIATGSEPPKSAELDIF